MTPMNDRIAAWTIVWVAGCSAAVASPPVHWSEPIVQIVDRDDCDQCGPVCDCDACDAIGDPRCDGLHQRGPVCDIDRIPIFLPVLRIDWTRFEFGAGSAGVTGPIVKRSDANGGQFGYQQHFNESRDLRRRLGFDLAAQLGVRLTQLNLGGGGAESEKRNQTFVTGGLFRRVDYGLQYGVVADYLNDDWFADFGVVQVRGEIGWVATPCHSFGAMFAVGGSDDQADFTSVGGGVETVSAVDQYRGFYRYRISPDGGAWTSFLGGTGDDHLILGSDVDLPVSRHLALRVGSTYFAASDDGRLPGSQNSGWNLSIGVVFRPGHGLKANRYRRPLLDVADNGTLFLTR